MLRIILAVGNLAGLLLTSNAQGGEARILEWDVVSREHHGEGAVSPDDLLGIREIGGTAGEGLSVSPDGKFAAFEQHHVSGNVYEYRSNWTVASIETPSAPIDVGDAGDPLLFRRMEDDGSISGAWVSERPVWSLDSKYIYYRRRTDAGTQIWRSSRDGSRQEQLTRNQGDVQRFARTGNGEDLIFEADADRTKIARAAADAFNNGYLFGLDGYWSTIKGQPLEARYTLSANAPIYWIYDPSRGERLATSEEVEAYRAALQAPGGSESIRYLAARVPSGRKAWLETEKGDKQGVDAPLILFAEVEDGPTTKTIRCSAPECSPVRYTDSTGVLRGHLWWSDGGEFVYFVNREGPNLGSKTLYSWDVRANTVRRLVASRDWISDCNHVRNRAICFSESPVHPRKIISIELTDGRMQTIVDVNPQFSNLRLGEVSHLAWTDGHHSTFGFLVKPPGYDPGKKYPLLVVGYRASRTLRGGVGDEYPVHALAANGFLVLSFDAPDAWQIYETSADALEAFVRVWTEDLFEVRPALSLLEACVDLLNNRGLVDSRAVGITGFSTGASQAVYALANSKYFAAGSISNVMWSPVGYYLSGGGRFQRDLLRRMGFGPIHGGKGEGGSLGAVALSLNAERVDAPLMINASDAEYHSAMESVVALDESAKPVEMYVYPDEYHVKWYPAHRRSIYERNIDWFNYWLRGVVDRDPKKADQYLRWEQLRKKTHRFDHLQSEQR